MKEEPIAENHWIPDLTNWDVSSDDDEDKISQLSFTRVLLFKTN